MVLVALLHKGMVNKKQHCFILRFLPIISWTNTAHSIRNGDIKFQEMEELLGQEDYEQMKSEMIALKLKMPVINIRVDQLRKYRHIGDCVSGAKVILKFATEYQLEGDFRQIRNLALVSFFFMFNVFIIYFVDTQYLVESIDSVIHVPL